MDNKMKKILVGVCIVVILLICVIALSSKDSFTKKKLTMAQMGLREVSQIELQAPVLAGLSEHTAIMKIAIGEKFGIEHYSLFRPGDLEDHGKGHAVDYMVYKDEVKGDELAEFLVKHIDDLDIKYIIWKQKFYMSVRNIYGPANTWNDMPDRGSITANHYDHVHVSFTK